MRRTERPVKEDTKDAHVVARRFGRDLRSRRIVAVELPEFLLCALEARVHEANAQLSSEEQCSLDEYIESELVQLITLRDIAELEITHPGFSAAVHEWVVEMRE